MTREQFIEDLETLLALYRDYPSLPHPRFHQITLKVETKADLVNCARILGRTEKKAAASTFYLRHVLLGGKEYERTQIDVDIDREQVCERKITTITLPPEEARLIPALPERTIEKEEWVCPESILSEKETNP